MSNVKYIDVHQAAGPDLTFADAVDGANTGRFRGFFFLRMEAQGIAFPVNGSPAEPKGKPGCLRSVHARFTCLSGRVCFRSRNTG